LLAHPEEVGRDEPGQRLAILFLRRRGKLFAERLEAWIGDRLGCADGHRLVGLGRGGGRGRRRRRTARWLAALATRRRQLSRTRQLTLREARGNGGEQKRRRDGNDAKNAGLHRHSPLVNPMD